MDVSYTITVSEEVDIALGKVAARDGITKQELVERQIIYYIACALHDDMNPALPFNTPGLSIPDRAEAYAIYINQGAEAATAFVAAKLGY